MSYYEYYDNDYLDAVIFPGREEKNYEDCDTRVDMSWAENHTDSVDCGAEYEWCILQKTIITNAVKETKTLSYCPYEIFREGSLNDLQEKVTNLNVSLKEEPYKYKHKMWNGCSVKVLSFVWGIIEGEKDITGWERIGSGMIEIKSDGNHFNPLESDVTSVNIVFSKLRNTLNKDWIKFDTAMTPSKWHKIGNEDFTRDLYYNPCTNQTATYIDWEQ